MQKALTQYALVRKVFYDTVSFQKKPELGINKDSQNDAITDFINAAPDAKVKEKRGVVKGKRQQISITMPPDILEQIDEAAAQNGQSRAAYIIMSCINTLNNGLQIHGKKTD